MQQQNVIQGGDFNLSQTPNSIKCIPQSVAKMKARTAGKKHSLSSLKMLKELRYKHEGARQSFKTAASVPISK
jgi:hypothetical protein